jgi:flagellar motor switch protein FliM
MIAPEDRHLAAVRRLMQAVGQADQPLGADGPTAEYDWHVPYRVTGRQVEHLEAFGAAIAARAGASLGRLLREATSFSAAAPAQRYAGPLRDQLAEAPEYRLPVASGDRPCGLIAVNARAGRAWVAKLLGASSADGEREMSELESDLLADVVAALAQAVSAGCREGGAADIKAAGAVSRDPPELPGGDEAEYACFSFGAEAEAGEPLWRLAVHCEVLDPLVGAASADGPADPPRDPAAMAEHVADSSVDVDAVAGRAELTMADVMGLEVGDVLLLRRETHEPFELANGGRTVLLGLPVTCDGHYALRIVDNLALRPPE